MSSDLLSGLTDYDINPFDLGTMYENPEGGGQYVLKDDVREALRHPTDEQMRSIVTDPTVNDALTRYVRGQDNQWALIRAVLAALAGGDGD